MAWKAKDRFPLLEDDSGLPTMQRFGSIWTIWTCSARRVSVDGQKQIGTAMPSPETYPRSTYNYNQED